MKNLVTFYSEGCKLSTYRRDCIGRIARGYRAVPRLHPRLRRCLPNRQRLRSCNQEGP